MATDNRVHLPSGFGGLTRYHEEHESKFMIRPTSVIIFILLMIGLRILLPFVF